MLPIVINFLLAINIIVCLLIVLLVLMQRPKNEGLGAAFGGGMTDNLFGAQTTNVLQTITRWLAGMFFALTLLLSWLYVKKDISRSSLQQRLSAPTVIPATPAPVIPQGVPTTLPEAASAPVKPGEAPSTSDLEKSMSKLLEDAAKTAPAPGTATPMPAPADAPAPAPVEAKPADAPKSEAPAPAQPAPAPADPKPADAPKPEAPAPAQPAPAPADPKPTDAPKSEAPAPAQPAAPEPAKPSADPEPAKPAPTPEAAKPDGAPAQQ